MEIDLDIMQSVSTGHTLSDLITTLSSLVIRRALMEPRRHGKLDSADTAVIHVSLCNDNGCMEASLWVKWTELAPLMYADMLQKSSLTPTTEDLMADIRSSRGCPSDPVSAPATSPRLPPNY